MSAHLEKTLEKTDDGVCDGWESADEGRESLSSLPVMPSTQDSGYDNLLNIWKPGKIMVICILHTKK